MKYDHWDNAEEHKEEILSLYKKGLPVLRIYKRFRDYIYLNDIYAILCEEGLRGSHIFSEFSSHEKNSLYSLIHAYDYEMNVADIMAGFPWVKDPLMVYLVLSAVGIHIPVKYQVGDCKYEENDPATMTETNRLSVMGGSSREFYDYCEEVRRTGRKRLPENITTEKMGISETAIYIHAQDPFPNRGREKYYYPTVIIHGKMNGKGVYSHLMKKDIDEYLDYDEDWQYIHAADKEAWIDKFACKYFYEAWLKRKRND